VYRQYQGAYLPPDSPMDATLPVVQDKVEPDITHRHKTAFIVFSAMFCFFTIPNIVNFSLPNMQNGFLT